MRIYTVILSLLLASLLPAFSTTLYSQIVPLDEKTKLITYQEVVEVAGTKRELFNRAIDWVNHYYTNPVSVTKVRDFETGVIKGNHQFRITFNDDEGFDKNAGTIIYSFIIELKDGRYRYTVTDFVLKKASRFPVENWLEKSDPSYNPQWDYYIQQVDDFAKELVTSLKEKMFPGIQETEDNW